MTEGERENRHQWIAKDLRQKVPWPTTEVHKQGSSHMVFDSLFSLSPSQEKHGKVYARLKFCSGHRRTLPVQVIRATAEDVTMHKYRCLVCMSHLSLSLICLYVYSFCPCAAKVNKRSYSLCPLFLIFVLSPFDPFQSLFSCQPVVSVVLSQLIPIIFLFCSHLIHFNRRLYCPVRHIPTPFIPHCLPPARTGPS